MSKDMQNIAASTAYKQLGVVLAEGFGLLENIEKGGTMAAKKETKKRMAKKKMTGNPHPVSY